MPTVTRSNKNEPIVLGSPYFWTICKMKNVLFLITVHSNPILEHDTELHGNSELSRRKVSGRNKPSEGSFVPFYCARFKNIKVWQGLLAWMFSAEKLCSLSSTACYGENMRERSLYFIQTAPTHLSLLQLCKEVTHFVY